MMAVKIATEPEVRIGEPTELWRAPYFAQARFGHNYDVDSDGRFLMLGVSAGQESEPARIQVWLDGLSRPRD